MGEIPWAVVGPLLVVVVAVDVWLLLDLRRHDVVGPKPLWALIIVGSWPLGPVVYLLVGRQRPDETAPPPPPPPTTGRRDTAGHGR